MSKFPVSGKEMPEIDLRNISVKEWRAMFDAKQTENEGDATVAKVCGLSIEEVRDLPLYDYRELFKAIIEKSRQPLENDLKA